MQIAVLLYAIEMFTMPPAGQWLCYPPLSYPNGCRSELMWPYIGPLSDPCATHEMFMSMLAGDECSLADRSRGRPWELFYGGLGGKGLVGGQSASKSPVFSTVLGENVRCVLSMQMTVNRLSSSSLCSIEIISFILSIKLRSLAF